MFDCYLVFDWNVDFVGFLLVCAKVLEAVEGILEVQRALEDYLPVLIGLIEKGESFCFCFLN